MPGATSKNFRALGVNDLGEVVGTFGTTVLDPGLGEDGPAFHWQPSVIRSNFPQILTALTTGIAEAREINDAGVVVGFVGGPSDAYYWNMDSASDAGSLGLGSGSVASAINDETNARIVGTYIPSGDDEEAGFLLDFGSSTPTKLEPATTTWKAFARDISNVVDLDPLDDSPVIVGRAEETFALGECECADLECCDTGWTWIETSGGAIIKGELDAIERPSDSLADGRGVNDVGNIVGASVEDNDPFYPRKAVFWEEREATTPILLGDDPVFGSNDQQNANAISDPLTLLSPEMLHAVGESLSTQKALRWAAETSDTTDWTAERLEDITCLPARWDELVIANDINDLGWIVGAGVIAEGAGEGELRAFLLIPSDYCPGDIAGQFGLVPDGVVDTLDLLTLLAAWGTVPTCDLRDIDCDGEVGTMDLLDLLGHWGTCPGLPWTEPATLSAELAAVGLDSADWSDFQDVMAEGTGQEKAQYLCWMERYLSQCINCPACTGNDPFD